MSRLFEVIHGNSTDFWTVGDKAREDNFFRRLKADIDILAMGMVGTRNLYVGGAQSGIELSGEATGDFAVWNASRVEIDNTDDQLTDFDDTPYGAQLLVRFRYLIRVSNAAINVTPKIYNRTALAYATISGALACSATATDFSGTNQAQSIYLTPATGLAEYVPHFAIAGTPAAGYVVNVHVLFDLFIDF